MTILVTGATGNAGRQVVREPFAYARSALVHEGDIGAVAAAVLVRGGHGGRACTLTGPEALSVPEQVAVVGSVEDVLGRPARSRAHRANEHAGAFR
ncbi:hypothetical protein ACIRG5_20760 [Lentzea sp. NPDC102401]|uniref:hypothetical protein n=1 Tax=Lentzea sp. NPDC102401 TaxID=3364128 RepID=UPI003813791A